MSKSKTPLVHSDVASTLAGIADQISTVALSKAERQRLRTRNEITPDALVEMICHLAEQNGGHVLGMPFDAAKARATLANTSNARAAIRIGRQVLQRMEDDMIQQRVTTADPAFAIYTALRRLVHTEAGNHLQPAHEQMKAIVKNRPRKTRKKAVEPTVQAPVVKTGAAPGA